MQMGSRNIYVFTRLSSVRQYPHPRKYILSVANFAYKKGQDVLIRAFDIVHEKHPEIDLILAGDGSELNKCISLTEELGLRHSVKFLGRVDRLRIPSLMAGCELFVLPSRKESFGIVILEAMAAGKPIVATRVGGIPEVVSEGENAILVEPESPQALADGLMKLLENPDLVKRFGERGKEIVKNFTWDKIISRYIVVYESVIKTG